MLVDSSGEPLPITAAVKSSHTLPEPALNNQGSIHEKVGDSTAKQESEISQTCLLWMDHRAELEATEINSKPSDVLKFVGGGFSPGQILSRGKHMVIRMMHLSFMQYFSNFAPFPTDPSLK